MKKLVVSLLLSVVVAGALLWLTLSRMAGQVEGEQSLAETLWQAVTAVSPWSMLLYALSFMVVHVSRIARWVYQVRPLGEDNWRMVFRVCAVGYAAIVLFPWRLGEVVRPFMLARESQKVDFPAAMGTAVTERVIDGLLITLLLFVCVATAPEAASATVQSAGLLSLSVFASASVGIVLFAWQRPLAVRLLHATIGRASSGLASRLEGMLEGFTGGLASLRKSGALLPFLALTTLYWTSNALGIWILADAFGLEVPWYAGFGLLAVLVVGIMVPAGPGFLGNFQYFLGEGLRLYLPAVSIGAAGLAFSLTMNLVQLVLQVGFGIPFLAASGLGAKGLIDLQRQAQSAGAQSA